MDGIPHGPPTPVQQYYSKAALAKKEFLALLATHPNETVILCFLEQKPWLLSCDTDSPVIFSMLPSGLDFYWDIAFLHRSYAGDFLHLIKLASGTMSLFTRAGNLHSDFQRSIQELRNWIRWALGHEKLASEALRPLANVARLDLRLENLQLDLVFVTGRQSDLSDPARREKWRHQIRSLAGKIRLRTYDRFIEHLPMVSNFLDAVAEVRCCRCGSNKTEQKAMPAVDFHSSLLQAVRSQPDHRIVHGKDIIVHCR